jgi:hypothetical protein
VRSPSGVVLAQPASNSAAAESVKIEVNRKVMARGSGRWLFHIDSRIQFYAGPDLCDPRRNDR